MLSQIYRRSQFKELISKYDNFFFDCDGVLWKSSNNKIKYAFEALNVLKNEGKNVFFISNNCMRSRRVIQERLKNFGFETTQGHIHLSSSLLAHYIQREQKDIKKVYLIGMPGIVEEFRNHNIDILDSEEHNQKKITDHKDVEFMEIDKSINAVVLGYNYNINYYKMCYASLLIQENKAQFFASEDTPLIKFRNGRYMPSVGTLTQALTYGLREKFPNSVQKVNLSKPSEYALLQFVKDFKLELNKSVMIGDKIDTDLEMAKRANIDSILVLTGETRENNLDEIKFLGDKYLSNHILHVQFEFGFKNFRGGLVSKHFGL
ncbi:hypothetical protein ABPG74_012912 [Tetrahymena malaccensis]